jgi:hypothetical protein
MGGEECAAKGENYPSFSIVHRGLLEKESVMRFAVAGAGIDFDFLISVWWNGVIAGATPWMTAENPTNSIPRTKKWAVSFHRAEKIV